MASTAALPKRSEVATQDTWNLETIFETIPDWEASFKRVTEMLPDLAAFQGKLNESGETLLAAFTSRDSILQLLGKLYSYAHMRLDEDTTNSTYQALNDRVSTLYNEMSTIGAYMTPEVLAIPEKRVEEFLREVPGLQIYRHVLDEINRQRAHVLDAEQEALLALSGEATDAASRAYEMLNYADMKLPMVHDESGAEVPLTQGNYVAKFLENQNREVRREAFAAMLGAYQNYSNTLAATLSGQVKRDIFYARSRHYASALEAALDPNNIPVSVYDSLVTTVGENLSTLHRYLALRKRLLSLNELHMYDLYVPMVGEVEYRVTFAEAAERVAHAMQPLGDDYVQVLRQSFGQRWVDVYENEGKRSGAYSSGAYGTMPFILLNYQESMDSMFTLAHELGHSMHSYNTWKNQPYVYGNYTLFVAEVASTLNEALLTHYLLQNATDRNLKMYIINHALETFRTTLYRQTLFAEFERDIHARVEAGEALTAEALSRSYKALNDKYYGAEVEVDDLISIEWARIPHFYYNFYVYQYATGISASAALAHQILTEGEPAVKRYQRFLASGSSDYSINLLAEAGVDLSTPVPIQQALDTFARYLGDLESLIE
jgi:oligoendopeptidase F